MNALVQKPLGAVSSVLANSQMLGGADDLSNGVQGGFAVMSYRGRQWRIKKGGDEINLLGQNGDPLFSIEMVILKSSPAISKIFYVDGYVDGSNAAPDCFSVTGIAPDPQSPKRQASICAQCPQNVWGSKITPQGKKGKACADSRRLAVVPLGDIENETHGGPMLLRVPAASLGDLAAFGKKMQSFGYPYNAVGVRISFDMNEAYPKLVFNAIRVLTDEEATKVVAHLSDDKIGRILQESEAALADQQAAAPDLAGAFEQPPAAGSAPAAAAVLAAAAAAPVAPQPTAQPATPAQAAPAQQPTAPAPAPQQQAAPQPAAPQPQAAPATQQVTAHDPETGEVVDVSEDAAGATGAASFDDMLEKLMG